MAPQAAPAAKSPPLDIPNQFFDAMLANNPFAINRVSDPSQMDSDVTSIHKEQFDRLVDAAEDALRDGRGAGALLLGGAGLGKSHLLCRFSRWAAENHRACFVFLHNIQVTPEDMGRYLLKCCVSHLAEDRLDRLNDTLLFRIVAAALRKAASQEGIKKLTNENQADVYRRLAKRLGGDERVFDVIFKFFFNVARAVQAKDAKRKEQFAGIAALAVRWLKGDLLDTDEARRLGQLIPAGQDVAQLATEQVDAVLLTMARLARESGRPFILCIDQADNMKRDQVRALSQTLHALIDHAQNMLVVVSGVQADMLQLIDEHVITEAAADRLNARQPIVIKRIERDQAKAVLRERLIPFLEQHGLQAEGTKPFFQDDDLFPLGSDWFEKTEPESIEVRPRDALTWASDRWRTIQRRIREEGGPAWLKTWNRFGSPKVVAPPTPEEIQAALDQKVAYKLAESLNGRRLQPGNLPADAGNLLGLTRQLLEQCLHRDAGYTLARLEVLGKRQVDMIVHETLDGRSISNHVQFVVTGSKTSATSQLRKLLESPGADHRILVTDHERAPLQKGPKGHEYLVALENLGRAAFTHVPLTFDEYAELDAMMSVVAEARSKDLELELPGCDIRPVEESEVIDSFHRHDRYRRQRLLQVFLTEELTPPPLPSKPLPENEFRAFVLQKLCLWTGGSLIEVTKSYLAAHPRDGMDFNKCLPTTNQIVRKMHDEELISAKPWENDLFLTIGSKAWSASSV